MNSDKTLILMDTNKIRSTFKGQPRYDGFDFGREFKKLQSFINEYDLTENIILAITDMTLQELLIQKKKIYEKDKKDFMTASERLQTLENVSIPAFVMPDDSFDCIKYLNPKVKLFLLENNITTIKINDNEKASVFDSLVCKVIESKPPFIYGKNSGFKDAVIWETLNKYNMKHNYTNVILFTQDNDFDNCEIVGTNFQIIKSIDELTEILVYYTEIISPSHLHPPLPARGCLF